MHTCAILLKTVFNKLQSVKISRLHNSSYDNQRNESFACDRHVKNWKWRRKSIQRSPTVVRLQSYTVLYAVQV